MSSQGPKQAEQDQINPANQSAKTTAGAAIGLLIRGVECIWTRIKDSEQKEEKKCNTKYKDSEQKEEQKCNTKHVIEDSGNQKTTDKVDGKQEPKTEKTEEKTDVKNNKQTTDRKDAKQDIITAFESTRPSNNKGNQASALPSNNKLQSIAVGG
jgi:hypothetical protein